MSWIEIIADRKIKEAQDEGAFDNLPGKGKPLNLEADARVPPELRAAYRMMKEAQLLPDWVQLDKDLRLRQERWQEQAAEFRAAWEADYRSALAGPRGTDARLDARRDRFLLRAAEELREQNRLIDRLNLIVPTPNQQRLRIRLAERLAALEAEYPRTQPLPAGVDAPWATLLHEERPPTQLGHRVPLRRRKGSIG
jgi:hypothetical protein